MSIQILLFTKNGSKIPNFPKRPNLKFKHIRFETNNLDDLLTIAKFRIINFPTSLIINGRGKILLRIRGAIPSIYVDKFLA
jgi:hypothetical protein